MTDINSPYIIEQLPIDLKTVIDAHKADYSELTNLTVYCNFETEPIENKFCVIGLENYEETEEYSSVNVILVFAQYIIDKVRQPQYVKRALYQLITLIKAYKPACVDWIEANKTINIGGIETEKGFCFGGEIRVKFTRGDNPNDTHYFSNYQ